MPPMLPHLIGDPVTTSVIVLLSTRSQHVRSPRARPSALLQVAPGKPAVMLGVELVVEWFRIVVVHQRELCVGCQRLISGEYLSVPLSGGQRAQA